MSATINKSKPNKIGVESDFAARKHQGLLQRRRLIGLILLILVITAVAYGVYRYKLRGLFTRDIAEHLAVPPDRPPRELSSFPIRYAGEDLTPRSLAFRHDTLFVAFREQPIIQLYNSNLAVIGNWRLQRPDTLYPAQIAVTDSFFVASDTTRDLIGIYDLEGFYIASVAWYPERSARVSPAQMNVSNQQIAVIDDRLNHIASVSLINDAPFHKFLELLQVIPSPFKPDSAQLSCVWFSPDSNIWLGTSNGKAVVLSPETRNVTELGRPELTRISHPVEFIEIDHAIRSERDPDPNPIKRIHMLDRIAGKVFVYDLTGQLTLVYPQDRSLETPLAITANHDRRHIYIAESGRGSVTVFGF